MSGNKLNLKGLYVDVVEDNVISQENVENIDVGAEIEEIKQIGSSEKKKVHRFQGDVETAQTAIKVGASLSTASSFVHGFVFVVLALFTLKALRTGADMVAVVPLLIGAVGLLISWAIVYALLSIVVTNALTAKHAIYQSSRL